MTGAELQEAREALGWTIYDLAREAEVSVSAVWRWEHDERRMSKPMFERVQGALARGRLGQATGMAARRPRRRVRRQYLAGAQLREMRLAAGWTMTELGRRVGVGYKTVSQWEREQHGMTRRHYRKLLGVLESRAAGANVDKAIMRSRSFGK
jgi:transcriptional regulator with XRE-family HTH domain